jgi:hypothetical protein
MTPRQSETPTLVEISRQLGELTAETRALRRDVDANERRASEGRGRLHAGLENVVTRLAKQETKADAVQATLTTIKPFAEKVDRWEQRGKGAAAVIAALGVIAGGLLATFWSEILSFCRFIFGGHIDAQS